MISFKQLFALLFLVLSVIAQSANPSASASASVPSESTSQSALEACAQKNGCSVDSMACRALCTGVPNPSPAQITDTNNCVAGCNQTDIETYKTCTINCINKHFRKIDIPVQDTVDSNGNRKNTSSKSGGGSSNAMPTAFMGVANLIMYLALGSLLMAFA